MILTVIVFIFIYSYDKISISTRPYDLALDYVTDHTFNYICTIRCPDILTLIFVRDIFRWRVLPQVLRR